MKPDFEKMELIPAIVQDFYTKEVLMLAYVNEESYDYMLKNKETCFYSRSRKELWHKGETSGHYQKIKSISLDCDKDTLLIQVEQIGAACHTGSYSCFFNEVQTSEEEYNNLIIEEVYKMIKDRKENPREGSYTNYLLEKGVDKICKKIGEEASETIIAAKNTDKEELIGEISDLAYHVLVLMLDKNITVEDIKMKLSERHKIEGNKKQENKKGAY
ncbi:MAG: bifunctional phosphoribosyl-AMP cyclohydrolase/phosphoribosyl-ATP diphosphatase HisIE [Clostridiales bacterium]|nr:bifunctional phosphoribosyl-AMP cyclohydrolase/phosphoribosyl-ATP diphosphatase HisIE [Clostridiales bacterium]